MKRIAAVFLLAVLLIACPGCAETEYSDAGIWASGGSKPYDYSLSKFIVLGEYTGVDAIPTGLSSRADARLVTALAEGKAEGAVFSEVSDIKTGDVVTLSCRSYDESGAENGFLNSNEIKIVVGGASLVDGIADKYISRLAASSLCDAATRADGQTALKLPDYLDEDGGKLIVLQVNVLKTERADVSAIPEAMREELSAGIAEREAQIERYAERKLLWQSVVDSSTFFMPLPQAEIDRCKKEYTDYYKELAAYSGCSYSEYISALGLTERQILENAGVFAEKKVKSELTAFAIACEEGLLPTMTEYEQQAYNLALELGYSGYDDMLSYNSEESIYIYTVWISAADFVSRAAKSPESE